MKSLLARVWMLTACLPMCILAPAAAQSLGNVSADPWVGRPLDLSVPARFASADAGDECVQADVFYGDQRLPREQVRTALSGPPGDRRVRVAADTPIDEPVVTVSLRAGCRNSVTRTYTLLPSMPTGPTLAAAAARTAGAAGGLPLASPVRLAAATSTTLRPQRAPAAGPTRARAERMQRAPAVAAGGVRLRLEAWEPEAQLPQATLLRVSSILSQPTQDAAARATAALLWQAVNADPSELMRASGSLQRLEGELSQLRSTADQTRAEMAALRQALDEPPAGLRLSGPLGQFLILLLLAGGAGAAFLWWRTARQQHLGGWRGQALDSTLDSAIPPPEPHLEPQAMQRAGAAAVRPAALVLPTAGNGSVPARAELEPLEFDMAVAPVRPPPQMRVETLAATFQEAEFLTSLGLWGDALDVLKLYIEDSTAPAPVAYFELMRLYAHADDLPAIAAVRRRYAQVFGAEAPPLETLAEPSGLQARGELVGHITRAWGTPQALEMIEALLFTVPAPDQSLSLEAGRDLLCLYQVAAELQRVDAAPGEAHDGDSLAPWAHVEDPGELHAATQGAGEDAGGYAFGLDLDLGAQPAPLPPSQPEEERPEPLRLREPDVDPLLADFEAAVRSDAPHSRSAPLTGQVDDPFSNAVAHESRRPLPR